MGRFGDGHRCSRVHQASTKVRAVCNNHPQAHSHTLPSFMAQHTLSLMDVPFIACNTNPNNNTHAHAHSRSSTHTYSIHATPSSHACCRALQRYHSSKSPPVRDYKRSMKEDPLRRGSTWDSNVQVQPRPASDYYALIVLPCSVCPPTRLPSSLFSHPACAPSCLLPPPDRQGGGEGSQEPW